MVTWPWAGDLGWVSSVPEQELVLGPPGESQRKWPNEDPSLHHLISLSIFGFTDTILGIV